MTAEDKKMRRYTAAVARRLDLPREIRSRVMADFADAISDRKAAGRTDAEIYEEFGTPKKAAADLNEKMKAFTYRKSPWRYLFAVCAAYGAAKILGALWVNLIYLGVRVWDHFSPQMMAVSVGVIGGADGPTAIFVTTPPWVHYLLPLVMLALGIFGFVRLSRCKRK